MYNWGTQKRDALMLKIVKIGPEDPFPSIPQFEFVTGYPQITPGLSSISVEKKWPSWSMAESLSSRQTHLIWLVIYQD